MTSRLRIRLGTRASALAQWQAQWVASHLTQLGVDVTLVPITTAGDRHQQKAIGELGERGLFTKEIQRALVDNQIDLAVHSLKDLPTDETPGLALSAVPERAPLADTLICRECVAFQDLPIGAVVGTGSLRRRAQLLHLRPDLKMKDLRGNVDTRLRKLAQGEYDAIVLAEAGLRRLGLVVDDRESANADDRFSVRPRLVTTESEGDAARLFAQRLGPPQILPAVGQGALGLETRSDDRPVREAIEPLNDPATWGAVLAERAMLAALRGGCLAPIAAWGRLEDGALVLTGRVLSADGTQRIEATRQGNLAQPVQAGQRVADELLSQGASALVEASRGRA